MQETLFCSVVRIGQGVSSTDKKCVVSDHELRAALERRDVGESAHKRRF